MILIAIECRYSLREHRCDCCLRTLPPSSPHLRYFYTSDDRKKAYHLRTCDHCEELRSLFCNPPEIPLPKILADARVDDLDLSDEEAERILELYSRSWGSLPMQTPLYEIL